MDSCAKWLNAKVVDLKHHPIDGLQVYVTYTDFSSDYNEWLPANSPRILPQFKPGMSYDRLRVNNRIVVLDGNKWREAIVKHIDRDYRGAVTHLLIHFKGLNSKYDVRMPESDFNQKVRSVQAHHHTSLPHSQTDTAIDSRRTSLLLPESESLTEEELLVEYRRREKQFEQDLAQVGLQIV